MPRSALQEAATGRTNIFRVPPEKLKIVPGWNCRNFEDPNNLAHIEELRESIRHRGVQEPLTVRVDGDNIYVINGECRLRACMSLIAEGVKVGPVPCQSEGRHVSEADEVESQITRNSGKPFTPLELCAVFHRLYDLGRDEDQIAAAAGYTPERVRQIMLLNRATEKTKEMIRRGEVSATTVQRALESVERPIDAERMVRKALKVAQKDGGKRASPRHMAANGAAKGAANRGDAPRTNYKSLIREIIENAKPRTRKDGAVTVTLPGEVWHKLEAVAA